jgi:hypothetical protein
MFLLTYYYTTFLVHLEEGGSFFEGDSTEVFFRTMILILSMYLGSIELIQAVTVPFKTYIRSVSNLNYVFMLVTNMLILIQHSYNNWS